MMVLGQFYVQLNLIFHHQPKAIGLCYFLISRLVVEFGLHKIPFCSPNLTGCLLGQPYFNHPKIYMHEIVEVFHGHVDAL